ncbi:MAG: tetratricopeptide repeat protein [Cyanobacteria bacterium SZAS-4]|nr:tetratricopeptide repeat protein [Cyanobacteria bacterium SZAS-4]
MHCKLIYIVSTATVISLVLSPQPLLADEYATGASAYCAGDFAAAKTHFIKAAKAKPKSWQAHYQLANTYVQLKDSASAKASYLKCIASRPPADIQSNCKSALAYIATNPKLIAPAAVAPARASQTVPRVAPKQSGDLESTASTTGGDSRDPAVSPDLALRRARILQDGEAEVNRMKAQEKEKQADAEANSNQRYIQVDGTIKTSLSTEELAQMQREVEQKATAIREQYKRKAAALR